MHTGLLVVDLQPAYAAYSDSIATRVAQRINRTVKPTTIMWVGEGLTDDCEGSVREYLCHHGVWPRRLEQATFVEKSYGFLRGWMDQGVDSHDIIRVGRELCAQGVHSSEDLDLEALYDGDPPEVPRWDHLQRPAFDDRPLLALDAFETCGGGSQECLAEMELWLRILGKPVKRLEALVY